MHNPFPKKKSKLPPVGKAIAAATVVHAVMEERMDDKQAGIYLREQVGLQWTMLTAFQYLTGQEAIGALNTLPEDWIGKDGMTKARATQAVLVANHFCANFHPSGQAMSGGLLISKFRKLWDQRKEKSDITQMSGRIDGS